MDQISHQPAASPFNWPGSNRIAVIVTVLLENWAEGKAPPYGPMTTALRPGTTDHAGITWSEYGGKAGIWRLMRILDRRRIKATIVANVRSIELHGAAMRQAVASGHEIAAHSYTQDQLLAYMDRDEELATISTLQAGLHQRDRAFARRLAEPGRGVHREHVGTSRPRGLPMAWRLQ